MKVIIAGGRGQLGKAINAALSANHDIQVWNRPDYDITVPAISDKLENARPDLVINAAAWTDVDGAEQNPNAAYAANALGPQYLAEGCRRCNAQMVQVSTNEVFAGEPDQFYREYDQPNPASVYARSKYAGEQAVQGILASHYIVRVAWLFGIGGNNFPTKIKAAAHKYGKLQVVNDEFGNPTYATDVALGIARLIETSRYGIYHIVNSGYASRFEFAQATLQSSGLGDIKLTPIPGSEWQRATTPPSHAVLINQAAASLGIEPRPWRDALTSYLDEQLNERELKPQRVLAK